VSLDDVSIAMTIWVRRHSLARIMAPITAQADFDDEHLRLA
jgi:hypothetical protein